MAGLGRRTHYRKHLTDAVLHDLPEPGEDEKIARVVATRGGNQFEICLPSDKTIHLAILPTKFHKLVWVKRGDFVLVEVGTDSASDNIESDVRGFRHMISHILYKDQIKHLKAKGIWPCDDPEFLKGVGAQDEESGAQEKNDDGIVYQDCDEHEDDLFVNTNRVSRLQILDSSDEDSSDDEN